jgi:cytoskeletal protein CcmA (bactofilin family)
MWRYCAALLLAAAVTLGAGCGNAVNGDVTATREGGSTVNGSVRVPAGQQVGSVNTVNGSINIEDNATVGAAHTVNGEIKIGAHSIVESAVTVNGSVVLGDSARVKADARSVNGEISLAKDAEVAGSVNTVAGSISLTDAHVHGGLRTVAANIQIMGASHVEGGILVEKNSGDLFSTASSKPRIVIGPGAVVEGSLRFEREVQLYVSDKATIGPVAGATAVAFSGDKPPG